MVAGNLANPIMKVSINEHSVGKVPSFNNSYDAQRVLLNSGEKNMLKNSMMEDARRDYNEGEHSTLEN